MRGGVTNPDQLIRLGEVAKKYDVPLVKVTGSQRIGLYGISKEDLPKVWKDLGMRSASAYAKKTRSVKVVSVKNSVVSEHNIQHVLVFA